MNMSVPIAVGERGGNRLSLENYSGIFENIRANLKINTFLFVF